MKKSTFGPTAVPEACCSWCQRPARLCRDASCDDAPVYVGVPSASGRWTALELETRASEAGALQLAA